MFSILKDIRDESRRQTDLLRRIAETQDEILNELRPKTAVGLHFALGSAVNQK